jgi:hypothetical protein
MTNIDAAPAAAPAAKRRQVTERTWLDDAGGEVKDPRYATGIRIEVLGAGTFEAKPEDYSPEVQNALTLFGLNIVLTNTLGGLAGAEAYEALQARDETLRAGEWTSRKGAEGPRISLLVQAMVAALAKDGIERDPDDVKTALIAKGEEGRKAVLGNPKVRAEYDRLRAEAAAKRAAESAAKAGAAEGDLEALL